MSPQESKRVQMADSHLTYIGTPWNQIPTSRNGVHSCYDVYPRGGGHQLGWVYRRYGWWVATSDDPTVDDAGASTRWEAATALWGVNQ